MAKVYAILNQKGGVGKTTTSEMLAAGLSKNGHRVLAVDLDAQGNMTHTFSASDADKTVFGTLIREATAKQAIRTTPYCDLLPSSKHLAVADSYLTETGKEYRLKEVLESIMDDYDYVVIDTPPTLGILIVNAIVACDEVIIPVQADIFSAQGVSQLMQTIEPAKKYCNPNLKIAGILLTRFNERLVISRDVREQFKTIADSLGTKLFTSVIREAVAVREAQILQKTLYDYAPNEKVTADYEAFLKELTEGTTNA